MRLLVGAAATAAVTLAFAAVPAAPAPATATPSTPNIVVIMTDDQALNHMRAMPLTTALIGDAGTVFDNFIVSYPLCCPSRAAYLTGQYALHNGVRGNVPPQGGFDALDHTNTLPVWLDDAGYRTIHIGKYLNGYGPLDQIPPGWDDWQGLTTTRYFNYSVNDNGEIVSYGSDESDYQTDVLAARAVASIDEAATSGIPFFLNVAVHAPHADNGEPVRPAPRHEGLFSMEPLPTTPSFNEADVSDKPSFVQSLRPITATEAERITARYRLELEALASVDDLVAGIVTKLDAVGELENTVIVFTSDNGLFHGQHRIQGGKARPYEAATRVPLMVRGPTFPVAWHEPTLAANVDLASTIAALAGATPGRPQDGVDLRAIIDDPAAYDDRAVLVEGYGSAWCYEGLHMAEAVYIEHRDGQREYYDLAADPDQLDNAHGDPAYAEEESSLQAQLAALLPEQLASCATAQTINVGDVVVTEAAEDVTVKVPVTLTSKVSVPVTVPWTAVAGTAGTRDAVLTSGTVEFSPKKLTAWIPLKVKADDRVEGPESLTIELGASDPAALGRATGTVTIRDRADSSVMSVGDVFIVEVDGNGRGTDAAYIPITLSEVPTQQVTLHVWSEGASATAGLDFEDVDVEVTVRAGKCVVLVPVTILGDLLSEVDETVVIHVTSAGGLAPAQGTVIILDEDDPDDDPGAGGISWS